jgi:hypothetical protein
MQPNKSWTPWGFVPGLVTLVGVVAAIYIGFGLLALIPATGFGAENTLEDHLCVTTSVDESAYFDDSGFGKASSKGVRSMPTETAHCEPFDFFDHPNAARTLAQIGHTPIAIAVLVLALLFRRIIKQTWENGPFHLDTTRRLSRFRWIVAGAVGAALLIQWIAHGVTLQLLTDDPWPGLAFMRTTALVWVAAALVTLLCEFGARQRQDAWQQGLNARPGGE